MTKKDFELIAQVLAQEQPACRRPYFHMSQWAKGSYDQWNTIRLRFAARLAFENPEFDADKFNEACHAPD